MCTSRVAANILRHLAEAEDGDTGRWVTGAVPVLTVLERSQLPDIRTLASGVLVRLTGSSSGAHLTSGQRSLQACSCNFCNACFTSCTAIADRSLLTRLHYSAVKLSSDVLLVLC